jgi:transcriptional regulator with XRE-family HTH domain
LHALGQRLAELRRQSGLTQAKLARGAEVTALTVWRIEKSRRRTRATTLGRMATTLVGAGLASDPDDLAAELIGLAGPASSRAQHEDVPITATSARYPRRGPPSTSSLAERGPSADLNTRGTA